MEATTSTRYTRIAAHFRQQIETGELRPGDQLPSFASVRSQFGIGQSTLERAHELLERESLIVRLPGKGIFVAPPSKRPTTGIIGLRGVTAAKSNHPYFSLLLEGIHEGARRIDREILLVREDGPVMEEKMDGLLLYSVDPATTLRLLSPSLPCVSVLNPARGVASLVVDDRQGIVAAMHHLWNEGHRRIAYLAAWPSNQAVKNRIAAYHQTLAELGGVGRPEWIRHLPDPEQAANKKRIYREFLNWGYEFMAQWLVDDWAALGCTALLVHNDDAALGAMRALSAAGYSIPEDVSVVGYDDTLSAELAQPPLTTVHVPLRELGERAVELLWAEIQAAQGQTLANPTSGGEESFSPHLNIRESTHAVTSASVVSSLVVSSPVEVA